LRAPAKQTCAEIRAELQDQLDGPIAADRAEAIASHLASCAACREYRTEMQSVVDALRELRLLAPPLPDEALDAVWQRTSRAPRRRFPLRLDWRIAAAAAIVTVALLPSLFRPVRSGPSPVEIARARDEARLVLGLAGRAIRTTERARDQVMQDEIPRALRHLPLRLAPRESDDSRRQRS
jgi:hypothetical protein